MKIFFVWKGIICRLPAGQYLLVKILRSAQIQTIQAESAGKKKTIGRKIHPKTKYFEVNIWLFTCIVAPEKTIAIEDPIYTGKF